MAITLTDLFDGMADAIREASGSSAAIVADDFPDNIRALGASKIFNKETAKVAWTLASARIPGLAYSESKDLYYSVGKSTDSSAPRKLYRVILKNTLAQNTLSNASITSTYTVNDVSCVGITGAYVYAGFKGNTLELGKELLFRRYSTAAGTTTTSNAYTGKSSSGMDYEMTTCVSVPSTDDLWFFGNYNNSTKSGSYVTWSSTTQNIKGFGSASNQTPAVDSTLYNGYPVSIYSGGVVLSPYPDLLADPGMSGGSEYKYTFTDSAATAIEGKGIWTANNKIIACIGKTMMGITADYLYYGETSNISAGLPSSWKILGGSSIKYYRVGHTIVDVIYYNGCYLVFYEDGVVRTIGDETQSNVSLTYNLSFDTALSGVRIVEVQYINNKFIITGWYGTNQENSFVAYYDVI